MRLKRRPSECLGDETTSYEVFNGEVGVIEYVAATRLFFLVCAPMRSHRVSWFRAPRYYGEPPDGSIGGSPIQATTECSQSVPLD